MTTLFQRSRFTWSFVDNDHTTLSQSSQVRFGLNTKHMQRGLVEKRAPAMLQRARPRISLSIRTWAEVALLTTGLASWFCQRAKNSIRKHLSVLSPDVFGIFISISIVILVAWCVFSKVQKTLF